MTRSRACILSAIAVALTAAGCTTVPPASERILSLHADVVVHADGTASAQETVRFRSAAVRIQHGLVRQLPTVLLDGLGRRHEVSVEPGEVLLDGQPIRYGVERLPDSVQLLLGDPAVALPPGEHAYTIAYRTAPRVFAVGGRLELPWTVSAPGGLFPVDAASVSIALPPGVQADAVTLVGRTGPRGAEGQDFVVRAQGDGRVEAATTRGLGLGEGFAVLLAWPAGPPAQP